MRWYIVTLVLSSKVQKEKHNSREEGGRPPGTCAEPPRRPVEATSEAPPNSRLPALRLRPAPLTRPGPPPASGAPPPPPPVSPASCTRHAAQPSRSAGQPGRPRPRLRHATAAAGPKPPPAPRGLLPPEWVLWTEHAGCRPVAARRRARLCAVQQVRPPPSSCVCQPRSCRELSTAV